MITLKHLLTEQTAATIYCKRDILSKPQFSANKWKSIGIWSNRNIGNTNRKSEHAFGNAIDWSGKGGVGDPVMQELANYLVSKADVYNIQNIIYNRKAWNSKQGWHTYKIPPGGSPHLDHVHVDFKKINATANIDNQKNNDLLQRAIWTIYNTITRYPERHFKQFKSWNPLKGGDNEGAAAKYFSKLYTDKINQPILEKIELTSSLEDKLNIENIRNACIEIYYMIKNGKSGKIKIEFYKWNPTYKRYKLINQTIDWNYM
jgi:hypothetical protein